MKFARRKHLDVQQVRRNIRRFSIPATPDGYPSLTLRRAKLRDDFSVFSSCDGESGGRWVLKLFETSALHRGERGETLQEKLRRRNNGAVAADRRCRSRTRREGGEVDLAPSTPAGSIPLGTPLVVGNPRQHSAVTRAVRNPRGPLPLPGLPVRFSVPGANGHVVVGLAWSASKFDESRSFFFLLNRDFTLGRFDLTNCRRRLNFDIIL